MNILELALLAYLGLFLILAKDFQQQAATSTQLDPTIVDSCGEAVPTISTEWIVLGVLYFLPVTVLLLLVGKWLCSRWFHVLRYVYLIIRRMQAFIIHIVLNFYLNCTKLYVYTYIILYVGNMCVGHAVYMLKNSASFTVHLCVRLAIATYT